MKIIHLGKVVMMRLYFADGSANLIEIKEGDR